VSVPLYFAVATLTFLGSPLWLVGAVAADVAAGAGRILPRTRALAFFGLYLGCELWGLAAAAAIWLGTLGGALGGEERYLAANTALQAAWAGLLLRGSMVIFSMRLEVEGQSLAQPGGYLALVRHSSTADTVLAAAVLARPGALRLRYVIKRELLWDPCLDVVGRRLPNAFIDRGAPQPGAELEEVADLARGLDDRSAVLIYPEGTRFTPAKRLRAVERLQQAGEARADLAAIAAGFRAVLPPRLGGVMTLLDASPGSDLVLLEHTGFEGAGSFADFWGGALIGQTIRVRLRRFPREAIPVQRRAIWLFERWAEMDDWICDTLAMEARA